MRLLILLLLIQVGPAFDQSGAGTIAGTVSDAETHLPLPAANIIVEGTVLGAMSDRQGEYRILNMPEGVHRIRFSVVGYRHEVREVTVRAGETVRVDVELKQTPLALPDVVVTAARKQQQIEEASASVFVVSAEQLQARAAPRLDVVLPLVPGVTMVGDQLGIRGSTGYNRGAGGRVLVLLDGVPALGGDSGNVRWDTLPAEVIERVEVVKGAASALYGSSAMGGVVNVLTRSAHSGPSTYARFRAGTWDKPYYATYRIPGRESSYTRGGEATVVRPIGKLGLLASGGYEYTDGYRENGWGRYGHLLLKIEGSEGMRDRWDAVATLARNDYGHFIEWRDVDHPYEVDVIARGDWLRSDKLMVTSTWRRLLGRAAYLQLQPHFFGVKWKHFFHDSDNRATVLRTALDAQAVTATGVGTVTLGGMMGTTGVDATMFGEHRVWEGALYLQDETGLTERVRMSVGGRLDVHSTDATPTRIVFSPRAALIHTPVDGIVLRISAGRGFRAPSVAEMFTSMATTGFQVIPNLELEPETVWNGEAGGSWMPLPVFRVEGSVFYNRYSSMIEGVLRPDGNIQFRNLHKARLQGVEVSVQATTPSGWLRSAASYLWLSTRSLDDGRRLAYRRPRRGSLTVEVLGGWWSLAADLLYGATVDRTAMYEYDRRIPFYRMDTRFSVRLTGMRIIVQVRNLTEYAYTDIERNLSPPREWLMSLEWSW